MNKKIVDGMPSTKHPLYPRWTNMKSRCYNLNDKEYHNYGRRGIRMCVEWRDSFELFAHDVGLPSFEGAELDRIDNDGNYEPNNVRWVPHRQNSRNTRRTTSHPGITCRKNKNKSDCEIHFTLGSFPDKQSAERMAEKAYAEWGNTLDEICAWADLLGTNIL